MDNLQKKFSTLYGSEMFNNNSRIQKAQKVLSIISNYLTHTGQEKSNLLDIGCSTGIMTKEYAKYFKNVIGIDIDEDAVEYAKDNFSSNNIEFFTMNSLETTFDADSFDIITCTHIYEHVPDSTVLLNEIYRLLKPGGICYFAAGNRLSIIEPHYHLPLLSIMPKKLAHLYLKILKKGNFYYENHLTYWGLKKLVKKFQIIDYTKKVIESPDLFSASEIVKNNSFKQKIFLFLYDFLFFLSPTYLWILKKD